ncbi:hypothetical protein HS125_10835 [bacterium]|nr:hypothetical protein [bacterium]
MRVDSGQPDEARRSVEGRWYKVVDPISCVASGWRSSESVGDNPHEMIQNNPVIARESDHQSGATTI